MDKDDVTNTRVEDFIREVNEIIINYQDDLNLAEVIGSLEVLKFGLTSEIPLNE